MPDREHSVAKNAAPFTFSCFPSTYFLSSFYFLPAVVLQAKVSHGVRRMENGPGGVPCPRFRRRRAVFCGRAHPLYGAAPVLLQAWPRQLVLSAAVTKYPLSWYMRLTIQPLRVKPHHTIWRRDAFEKRPVSYVSFAKGALCYARGAHHPWSSQGGTMCEATQILSLYKSPE